jgi:hypothetical protein
MINITMNTLLLLAALTFIPQDGCLLFVENGNRIVQNQTDSTVTHVAIIFKEENDFWVYEAVKPKVRKIKLDDYYLEIDKLNRHKREEKKRKVWLSNPDKPFNKQQIETMKKYLEDQIDRRYSVQSYLDKESGPGIHCCELTGEALLKANIKFTELPCADSPWDVWKKTKPFYSHREEIAR